MDSDSWTTRLLAASRRYQSRSAHGGGDVDGDDESRPEFLCPFCVEEFDIVGLCCHIDEAHPVEAKNGTNKADGLASRKISETRFTSQIDASSRQQIGRSKSASSRQQISEAIERYTTDGGSNETLEKGTIHGDDVFSAVDFTTGDEPWPIFKLQKEFNFPGKSPPLSAEFYTGWHTHWGENIAILYWLAY